MIKFNPLSPIGYAACLAGACLAGGMVAKLENSFSTSTYEICHFQTFSTSPPTTPLKGGGGGGENVARKAPLFFSTLLHLSPPLISRWRNPTINQQRANKMNDVFTVATTAIFIIAQIVIIATHLFDN